MTDYRQQAIKDVSKALKLDAEILARQMDIDPLCLFNSAPSNVYAVAQREARLRLEDAIRFAIEKAGCDEGCNGPHCPNFELRAALEAGKEKP